MKLLEKILLPVNFKSKFSGQLDLGINIAKKFNSELILLHVLPVEAQNKAVNKLLVNTVEKEFKAITKKYYDSQLKISTLIKYGNKFDQVLAVSEDENVNAIIIGNDNNISNNGKLNLLAEKLLRKSEKPVWVHGVGFDINPNSILCPVDFSDASGRALNNALKISRNLNSKLFVVNVFEPSQNNYSPRLDIDYKSLDKERSLDNEKDFANFLTQFNFSGVNYETVQLKGDAFNEIVKFIRQNKIELTIIGATGKSMISRILLGSLTEKIARKFPSSIITTKSENIINLKIDFEISNIEKHFNDAEKLEQSGFFKEAIEQLKICLQINDLHIPSLIAIIRVYEKNNDSATSKNYKKKLDEILKRLWDKKIEFEIRKHYRLGN